MESLRQIKVTGRRGNLVPLGEVVRVEEETAEKSIYHKNLMPVVYVTADVAGKVESPVYAILTIDKALDKLTMPGGYRMERYVASQPFTDQKYLDEMGRRVAHHLRGVP